MYYKNISFPDRSNARRLLGLRPARNALLMMIGLQFTSSCGPTTPASVSLSNEYLKPEVSKLDYSKLIPTAVENHGSSCDRPNEIGKASLAGAEVIATVIAKKVINFAARKSKEALEKYSKHTHFQMETLPVTGASQPTTTPSGVVRVSHQCSHAKMDNAEILTFNVRYYYRTGSSVPYGMKLRPVWFKPDPFTPEKLDPNSNADLAMVVAVTPIYFARNVRETESTIQLFSVKFPSKEAGGGGFYISQSTGEEDWASRPMMAAPPVGQIFTFKIEVLTGLDTPQLLEMLSKQIPELEDDLADELKEAL